MVQPFTDPQLHIIKHQTIVVRDEWLVSPWDPALLFLFLKPEQAVDLLVVQIARCFVLKLPTWAEPEGIGLQLFILGAKKAMQR